MITVSQDLVAVEFHLAGGTFLCPGCGGSLRPWGFARSRVIRFGVPMVTTRVVPRRARCGRCGGTHVLLAVGLAARRADCAAVITRAVELHVGGLGYQKIAVEVGRPVSTVRGWIRDFRVIAPAVLTRFTARVHRAYAQGLAVWPAPTGTVVGDALAMVMAFGQVLARRDDHEQHGGDVVMVAWGGAGLAGVGPWFFSKVGWPENGQHQLALPVAG